MTLLDTLTRERGKYGATIFPWDAVRILNFVAWEHRLDIQLVAAPPGGNGWPHPNGFIRTDKLADLVHERVIDVFEDGPDRDPLRAGPARVQLGDAGSLDFIGRVAPVKPIGLIVPGEPPLPDVPEPSEPPEAPEPPDASLDAIASLLPLLEEIVANTRVAAEQAIQQSTRLHLLIEQGLKVRFR